MKPSAPAHRLKRRAKLLARVHGIALHAALDHVAREEGFASWSMLAYRLRDTPGEGIAADAVFAGLVPGDLLLIGARPGQGKTLMGLKLAVEAMRAGRRSVFFSLEYTPLDMAGRFRAIGVEPAQFDARFTFDDSDAICAGHVMETLADAPAGTFAAIDYLQLLDQRRDKPALDAQIRALRAFARARGIVLAFISQIDRSYDAAAKPLPDLADVRLPNALDLSLFSKACFLHAGRMSFQPVG
ncbi:MAG: DNA helicase [Aquamicrobium sp.]|uniref:DNA helicase n=1 Tax=Aquamicrobium sp. TaxID=1872579 RepID=UPI00349EDE1E|nr:DNA helicase [Aquamicrobium sp.]